MLRAGIEPHYTEEDVDQRIGEKLEVFKQSSTGFHLEDLVKDLMGDFPERLGDEGLRHRYYKVWMTQRVKGQLKRTVNQSDFDKLGFIPPKCREVLAKKQAFFYDRTICNYVHIFKAQKKGWKAAVDIRMDMSGYVAVATDPFQELYEVLDIGGCNTVEEWVKMEQKLLGLR